MSELRELVVIGGGPGGYAAAFFAADKGLKVTLIDKELNPGGVCLYRGCIPSKALLHVAKLLREAEEASNMGVYFNKPKIDLDKLREFKDNVVKKMTGGLGVLSKQRKIEYIKGTASFLNSETLFVEKENGSEEIKFKKAILATGSVPITIPSLMVNSPLLMDSTTALDLPDIPENLLVIGGGYIGLELGSVYSALGSKVSVVEMTDGLLPGADRDLVRVLEVSIKKRFHKIMLNTKVSGIEVVDNGLKVFFEGEKVKEKELVYNRVLLSIGRKPITAGLGIENTKIQIDKKGFVIVNNRLETNDPKISAIGDIAGNPMLAHKATAEAKVAVECILGHKSTFEPNAIPAVVFTDPELAWAGLTELEANEKGINIEVAKFPWGASGRATTLDRNDGLTKLIVDPSTERILGMGIVGVGAGEMISEGVLAIEMAALAKDVALSVHPHPTLSETIMEAADSFYGESVHIYRPKK